MGKKFLVAAIFLFFISFVLTISFLQYSFENDFDYSSDDGILVLIFIVFPFFVGIFLLRRHFKTRKTSEQFEGSIIEKNPEKTHFWGCPKCGGDTQPKDGRQYCFSCNVYLE